MNGLLHDTFSELMARRVLWLFGAVTAIILLIVILTSDAKIQMDSGGGEMSMTDLNEALGNPMMSVFAGFVSILTFLAVASCCGILPNMLSKGRAEFYLSKPLSRVGLLIRKLIAIWMVYGGTVVVSSVLVLSAVYLVHGNFGGGVVWVLVFELIALAIWLSIIALVGIVSGSTVVSFMAVFIVWVVQNMLKFREVFAEFVGSKALDILLTTLYHITPKSSEIGDLAVLVAAGKEGADWMPLWTTLILTAVIATSALIAFRRKDY